MEGESSRFQEIIASRRQGMPRGICSVCSANAFVIQAAMERALGDDATPPVLIEATSNQVNQVGGYTGMRPADFAEYVFALADGSAFPRDRIILGGDHLGPHPWRDHGVESAMELAEGLIRDCVRAGYHKLHLDTSMPLADDHVSAGGLAPEVAAHRAARLCAVAEATVHELGDAGGSRAAPVYVIGTEVPTPGGSHSSSGRPEVTRVADFRSTVEISREAWTARELEDAWTRVVAVVVQPGVEFGDQVVHEYRREDFRDLARASLQYPSLVFEGHSTDYQRAQDLKAMVEDGIAVLKVGPALTFAMREAAFLLSHIEEDLYEAGIVGERSRLVDALDKAMVSEPKHWFEYYSGSDRDVRLARRYSLFDRARYYWTVREVREALEHLLSNLSRTAVPPTLLSQYLPSQYRKVREGRMHGDPESVIRDRIGEILDAYTEAVGV